MTAYVLRQFDDNLVQQKSVGFRTDNRTRRNLSSAAMKKRRRVVHTDTLEDRLAAEAIRLRSKAETMKPGPGRDEALRLAEQCEIGLYMSTWLCSPGLQPPD